MTLTFVQNDKDFKPQQISLKSNGDWYHGSQKIINEKVINYFESILIQEKGRYFLKNEREKVEINVEDTPLFAKRIIFYEIENDLNAEILFSNGRRMDFELTRMQIRQDHKWIYLAIIDGQAWPALILHKAKMDLVSQATALADNHKARLSFGKNHLDLPLD